jgi:hypothetical protein
MPKRSTPSHPRDCRNEPSYWFIILEIARERDDAEGESEAYRNLLRLGVHVAYEPYLLCEQGSGQ